MRRKKDTLVVDTRQPVAISYLRFSSPEQRKGNSTWRQTEDTEKWCATNGIPLDRELSCMDASRSAYRGAHRSDKAALGSFLELVKEGRVPRGSYLVIENLDRLSREDERTALRLWLDILDAGINIVQLHPETVFRHERSDMTDIIRAIIELSRGHSESRMKSVRSLDNWDKAVRRAREEKRIITRRLPSWVEMSETGLQLIPEKANVVKRIFELARSGSGANSLVRKLNAEDVPAFGNREPDEDNDGDKKHYHQIEGVPYGCGEWRTSYVRQILSDRRVLGEYLPRDAHEQTKGEVVPDYYPVVVSQEGFYAARNAIAKRTNAGSANGVKVNRQGRIGNGVANLFGGLMRNARDGSTYYAATRVEKGVKSRVLLNKSGIEGNKAKSKKEKSKKEKSKGEQLAFTFPYRVFERAVLRSIHGIDPKEIVAPVPITMVSILQGELNELRERKALLALELDKGNIPEIADKLRAVKAREEELLGQIDDNSEQIAAPQSDTWQTMRTLVDLLDSTPADELEDVRLRLRSALRRIIASVWILVVPRGRDRLCAVQVYFNDNKSDKICRNYLILFRPGLGGAAVRHCSSPRRAHWWSCSLAAVVNPGKVDLRQKQDAAAMVRGLEALDMARIIDDADNDGE
jgi:DNA invertase Pin-like site-specific DNA recombinase